MAWIEFHDTVFDHPKTIKLAGFLGLEPIQVVVHLVSLWSWAIRFEPGGSLQNLSHADISKAARWSGDPERFVGAMTACRFLDKHGGRRVTLSLHNWERYTRRYRRSVEDRHKPKRPGPVVNPTTDSPPPHPDPVVQLTVDRTSDRTDRTDLRPDRPDRTPPALAAPEEPPSPSGSPSPAEQPKTPDGPPALSHASDSADVFTPSDEVERLLLQRVQAARCVGSLVTWRKWIRGWVARVGADRLEQLLMSSLATGANVIQIDKLLGGDEKPKSRLRREADRVWKRAEEANARGDKEGADALAVQAQKMRELAAAEERGEPLNGEAQTAQTFTPKKLAGALGDIVRKARPTTEGATT